MSSPSQTITGSVFADARHFFWVHPEWWTAALCGAAWLAMLLPGWNHSGHKVHQPMSYAAELGMWMSMTAAMMLPLILETINLVATRSLWRRRHWAIALFLVGYLAVWFAAGIGTVAIRKTFAGYSLASAALVFAAASLWLLTKAHKQALIVCHRSLPLAPVGWRANWDCLRFGGFIGWACVRSCWLLMLGCMFAGHDLIAMFGGTAVGLLERYPLRPKQGPPLVATWGLAGYFAIRSVL